MRNRRFRDASPKEKMTGGLIGAAAGLIWTIGGSSLFSGISNTYNDAFYGFSRVSSNDSPFWMITAFGILFTIASLGTALSGYKEMIDEKNAEEKNFREAAHKAEEPARATDAVTESKNGDKKIVFCPYCGSAMDEDYKVCGSCGAGRPKSASENRK